MLSPHYTVGYQSCITVTDGVHLGVSYYQLHEGVW